MMNKDNDDGDDDDDNNNHTAQIRPDQTSFTTVLSSYAKSTNPKAAHQAEVLLDKTDMQHRFTAAAAKPIATASTGTAQASPVVNPTVA